MDATVDISDPFCDKPPSTKCSVVEESPLVMDYTVEFTTHEIFKSRETLCMWAREVGRKNGFVVVVLRSDVMCLGKTPRLTLGCERGGVYRPKKYKRLAAADPKGKKSKGTKKCDCPFTLKGKKMPCDDEWMLSVINGVHNHGPAEHFEGHSYAGRLTVDEKDILIDMSKSMAQPRDILATIKRKNEDNVSTLRTVYNARRQYRLSEKAGRSQMQYLLAMLDEFKYISWHRCIEGTDELVDLFWAHPHSIILLCAFPHVLIMDCTYKTNRYQMPLLEIVGVTSTNLTFSVAFVCLQSEQSENYTWALSKLKSVMDDNNVKASVIVTDRELGLMKAIETIFPNVNHMLCRWHISKNILAKCKPLFESKEKFERFMASWSVLIQSESEYAYEKHVSQLREDFNRYPKVLAYVSSTWLLPYRERFVSAWTGNFKHYGNTTTNRAESAHSKLKRVLGCSTSNFETSWPQIHNLLELQHTSIKASFEKSLMVVQHHFRDPLLCHLRGAISIFALDNIVSQFSIANTIGIDVTTCGCENRRIYGLPCAHEIANYIRQNLPIPLDSIDPHWTMLDLHPLKKAKEPLKEHALTAFEMVMKRFDVSNPQAQLHMINKLKELACPQSSHLMESV